MQRARRAANTVLALVIVLCLSSGPVTALAGSVMLAQAVSVAWPPSTLVVSEVQTGGASASDEFVEIANQGAGPVDLVGLEVVYATSSGSTVTRKVTWTSPTILDPGKRILIVNGAGSFVAMGDATYTSGFAATGGALALRVVGGSVVDAIGWGDATNGFVEGSAAPAPPAGSSLERRPGGIAGNGTDSNDNAADWIVLATPGPQNLAAAPVPGPGATPGPSATPSPTASATPTATPSPTPASTPSDTPAPTPDPTPTPLPTASPTPAPTPSPTPVPSPAPISIAAARALPDGATATISGVLTTHLGALESGRTAFLQDQSGGIAIYLDAAVVAMLPAGTAVIASGTVDERYAQRTLRVTESELIQLGADALPTPFTSTTGAASELLEGRVLNVTAPIVDAPEVLADGTAVSIDDGSGALRVIVTPAALGGRELAVGSSVTATGPLGQRDSTGTGTSGYRLYVTRSDDLVVAPSPSPTPVPTAEPTPTPTNSVPPTPTPSPSPSPSPAGSTIAAARASTVGSIVTVHGVVTAEAGRLGTPALFAIGDASGGIVVKLPSGVTGPARGRMIDVRGTLAEPYGQLEIRPAAASDLVVGGTAALPAVLDLPASGPSESSEGRLSRISGVVVVRAAKATSGDIGLTIETETGTRVRIMADASSGIATSAFALHARYRITGLAGQRASKKGAPDGYRIWARDPNDILLLAAAPAPSAGATSKPKSTGTAPTTVSIAAALRTTDRDVAIEAIITAPVSLLDSSGRRIVVQDSTAAVEVLLPKDAKAPAVGARIRVVGRIGTAYGAPRLRAESIARRGSGAVPAPLRVHGPLSSTHAWRLVSIGGRVDSVHKLGERWRAEIVVGATRIVIIGQPGSAIPSTALAEGGTADIVGIVRPAYPTATDRRAAVLPRSTRDVKSSTATSTGASSTSASGQGGGALGGSPSGLASSLSAELAAAPDADLVDLASLLGQTVRVGGLVEELRPTGFTLDDGTAVGLVVLRGAAEEVLPLVEPDDAINVIGRVESLEDGELAVVVDDPAAIALGSSFDGLAATGPSAAVTADATNEASNVSIAGFGDAADWLPGAGAGLAGLLGISLASVAVTLLRRRQVRRLMTSRVAARLATIGVPPGPGRDPSAT